jgi:UPF0755 protein
MVGMLSWVQLQHWLKKPLTLPPQGVGLAVQSGDSLTRISQNLAREGWLNWPRLLTSYARITEQSNIRAGQYQLDYGTTPMALLVLLNEGKVKLYSITLVEGWTWRQALAALHQSPHIDKLLQDKPESQIAELLGLEAGALLEGRLFPDTYFIEHGTSDLAVFEIAFNKMELELAAAWENRVDGLPYLNPAQALVMASIVEKETAVDSEREQIAGVFVERLRKNMRLQTDPTVIYALGDSYDGNIRRRDLKVDSPYNTYRNRGLPPGPIALPGARSIHAAMHPVENGMIYFVARGDGTHKFSATLQEHNQAVDEYQRYRRARNYRSTPESRPQDPQQ